MEIDRLTRIRSQFKMRETFILRDFLAMERTTLANERTLFSYIRSALYLALGAIAIFQLQDFASIKWLAYVIIALAVIMFFFGIIRYQILQKKLNKFYAELTIEQINTENLKLEDKTNISAKL